MEDIGFLLLCGGQSSRMGRCKALLPLGTEPLLEHVARAGRAFPERILSVNDPAIPTPEGFIRVGDVYAGCGPMGGLHAALRATHCRALAAAPCDAPAYSPELAAFLRAQMDEEIDALIPEDDTGRAHPTMGVYAVSCLPALEANLRAGRYKLMRTLEELRVRRVRLPEHIPQAVFDNINTPEAYGALIGKH